MDYVADSDTENSFRAVTPDDVNIEHLKNVVALFSEMTRERLRKEAENTPFAIFYEESESRETETPDDGGIFEDQNGDDPGTERLRHSENSGSFSASVGQIEIVLSSQAQPVELDTVAVSSITDLKADSSTVAVPVINPEPNTVSDTATNLVTTSVNDSTDLATDPSNDPSNDPSIDSSIDPLIYTSNDPPNDPSNDPSNDTPTTHEYPTETDTGIPGRRSRSLRKRTFASRHPYIADQADWLGICTHDSINEMFDGAEDISSVVRVLNQLYLKKKRRYPEEDRYRSKDFYTHLGHGKSLAVQGDSEMRDEVNASEHPSQADLDGDSGEQVYDPEQRSSQIAMSADEDDELIPYEDFNIPYSQDFEDAGDDLLDNANSRNSEPAQDSQVYHQGASDSSGSDAFEAEEEEEEEEQYIRVGGRYRKLSTILRGVLPESAKRLGIFDENPKKRRKSSKRVLEPRRGLAMKKLTSSGADTTELERELFAHSENNESIVEERRDNLRAEYTRPLTDRSMPQLSRNSTSFSYVSDTPEPQMVKSGSESESDIESWPAYGRTLGGSSGGSSSGISGGSLGGTSARTSGSYTTSLNRPVSKQTRLWQYAIDGEVQEFNEIDHLLAPREKKNKTPLSTNNGYMNRTLAGTRGKNGQPKRAYRKSGNYTKANLKHRRLATNRLPLGRPATTQQKRGDQRSSVPHLARQRKERVIDRVQQRLFAFNTVREPQTSGDASLTNPRVPQNPKPKSKPKTSNEPTGHFIEQHFKRNPVVSTSVVEVESTRQHATRPVMYDSVIQRFQPTRSSLLGSSTSSASNTLTGLEDIGGVRALSDGRILFPNEDSVTAVFHGKTYAFALYNPEDAKYNTVSLLKSLGKLLSNSSSLLQPHVKSETETAIRALMKWLLISRERPSGSMWTQMRMVMSGFSKLQKKEVRIAQFTIQSQLLFVFWIMTQLEHSRKLDMTGLTKFLGTYTRDFFVTFFSSFTAQQFSNAYATASSDHIICEGVMLVIAIYEKEHNCWWPAVVQAIDELPSVESETAGLLDLTYLLCAIIPKKHHNWSPYLAILAKLKAATDSVGHRHFIETCALAHLRLEWPLNEKILTQLYGFFGSRKFGNFVDESSIPASLQTVHTRSDIPDGSTFEKFLGLLYIYISELSSAKDVKRLISKLLASSQYHYVRGRKSQIMFVNRLNLIVLLSQISEVDLDSQLANLIRQICNSGDPFVYGRSLDALSVFCESACARNKRVPIQAFVMLFQHLAEMTTNKTIIPSCFRKLVDLMGHTFRGNTPSNESGVFGLLKILSTSGLRNVPNTSILELLGTVFLSIIEVEMIDCSLSDAKISVTVDFQKSLLELLGSRMNQFPVSKPDDDIKSEEIVELAIQVWILSCKISNSLHWNNMMYQRFFYLGNSIARHRFIMFFCLEYIQYGTVDSFVLQEIEKILLSGLVSPAVSKYSVDLYRSLNQNPSSIFHHKDASTLEITSVSSLQNNRLRILTKSLENVSASSTLHFNEKASIVSSLVKRLHDTYTNDHSEQGITDMCKRVTEIILKTTKETVNNIDEFWELSAKLGFPNKNVQSKWSDANNEGKVKLLNSEFVSALVYGKSHITAMNNWITGDSDDILFALLLSYTSALATNPVYWAHLALLLEYVDVKLENFEIETNHPDFNSFLRLLGEIALTSNFETNSKYVLHEIKAIKVILKICVHTKYVFDGYKDETSVKAAIFDVIVNVNSPRQNHFDYFDNLINIPIEHLQAGTSLWYHPNHQHTRQEYLDAASDLRIRIQDLDRLVNNYVREELLEKGLFNFDCF